MNPASTPLTFDTYQSCNLCPRMCGVNRNKDIGFCGCGSRLKAARAALHHWEEPCISGPEHAPGGSGTIFFSGCTLRCCFCQNHSISQEGLGKEISVRQLADIFLRLQDEGAHNLNLVTATQYLPSIIPALDAVKHRLSIPVVYNCGGYERVEVVKALQDYVDIWLPDFKYYSPELSSRYSKAPDYFIITSSAIQQMIRQTAEPEFMEFTESAELTTSDEAPHPIKLMTKGVIIRHMVLPGAKSDSIRLLHWIREHLPEGKYYMSIMSQYTPFYKSSDFKEINRRITSYEYNKVINAAIELGLTEGFMQEKSSAKEEYTPSFNLEGIN